MPDGITSGLRIGAGGAPISPQLGTGGAVIAGPGAPLAAGAPPSRPGPLTAGEPISPVFNIGGAPIAILGGVFSGGLPLAGPVTQIFRGGSAPEPPTLFIATLTPSGPIGNFLLGGGGAPIGVEAFGGGALPIGIPPAEARAVEAIQPRTALVGANPPIRGGAVPPAVAFGSAEAAGP